MAKIIKVGSQNPTFTSTKTKKTGSIQTHRNSNEATNPFKFTNFEGNTLQFADVFEGFKPSFKATPANKLRMIASSATGSMTKMKSGYESIVNFVKRIGSGISKAWDYASSTSFTGAISDAANVIKAKGGDIITSIKENEVVKYTDKILKTEVPMPSFGGVSKVLNTEFSIPSIGMTEKINGIKEKWNGIISNISNYNKNKYANMPVSNIRAAWIAINEAEGGIA